MSASIILKVANSLLALTKDTKYYFVLSYPPYIDNPQFVYPGVYARNPPIVATYQDGTIIIPLKL